jgi:hypothetical protein
MFQHNYVNYYMDRQYSTEIRLRVKLKPTSARDWPQET